MAETKPIANVKATSTSVQPSRSSNVISWIGPVACIIIGYVLWRFVLGNPANFTNPDPSGGFWPKHVGPKGGLYRMYEGGIIVPLLIGCFLTVVTFIIERMLTVSKASGKGNKSLISAFARRSLGARDESIVGKSAVRRSLVTRRRCQVFG